VFGLFPLWALLRGEDRSLPMVGRAGLSPLVAYLDNLPRIMRRCGWKPGLAADYADRSDLSAGPCGLLVSVGSERGGSAKAQELTAPAVAVRRVAARL